MCVSKNCLCFFLLYSIVSCTYITSSFFYVFSDLWNTYSAAHRDLLTCIRRENESDTHIHITHTTTNVYSYKCILLQMYTVWMLKPYSNTYVMYVYVCCDFVIFHLKIVSYVFILLVSAAVQRKWSGVFHTHAYKQTLSHTHKHTSASYVQFTVKKKKQTNQREWEKTRRRQRMRVEGSERMTAWANEMDGKIRERKFTCKKENHEYEIYVGRSVGVLPIRLVLFEQRKDNVKHTALSVKSHTHFLWYTNNTIKLTYI